MEERLNDSWQQLSDFVVYRNTIDLGALTNILDIFAMNSSLDVTIFANQIITFLTAMSSQSNIRPDGEGETLSLLLIDALINNLYQYGRTNDTLKPNSSSFYGWMSSSQMSIDQSQYEERQTNTPALVETLASSQQFFKKLKSSVEKGGNKQKNKKFVDSILETMDLIMSKKGISKETFLKFKTRYIGALNARSKRSEINYQLVNSVIFSSQLNKGVALLTKGGDQIHSALLRIYLSCQSNSDKKMFEALSFSGDEMILNLYRYYVKSFKEIGELFEESKHPLFRFLKNHFALLFTPVFRKFHQIIIKIALKCGSQGGLTFYQKGESLIQSELNNFINALPFELLKLLNQLKDLIDQIHSGEPEFILSTVKKLFFYSFLLNQSFLQELYPSHEPSKYTLVYNHIVILFFQSSIKKYNNFPQNQVTIIAKLIQKLSNKLDNQIINYVQRMDHEQPTPFKIRDSILNHDFELLNEVISSLEFTPKDSKQFQMKRTQQITPQSPVYKHFKGQRSKLEEGHSEVQFATWMSVGGSRQWGNTTTQLSRGGVAERLKCFYTIGRQVRHQLQEQSAEWMGYLNY